jgi:4-amino-4-deoxy-L-arabinose transferase-like glycosyltransferase
VNLMTDLPESGHSGGIPAANKWFAACLFVGVLASRALTSSSVYFADGPLHVAAAQNHTYVIQAPGYWLFTRIAGFFPDPEFGISVMNWIFSAGGATVFYLAIRTLVPENVARVSAIAYASIYFAWFSGNIHSTYASQLFFPVAVFLCLLRYREDYNLYWLIGASALFAFGTGFRPSDGVFFAPAFLFALSKAKRGHILVSIPIIAAICLIWFVPQRTALARMADPVQKNGQHQLLSVASGVLFSGFSPYAAADVLRYFLPLGLALFPLLPLVIRNRKDIFLWLWILPGTLFFLLVYISDSPYLDFLLAPLLILAATSANVSEKKKIFLFLICAAFNIIFYLAWRPGVTSNRRLQLAEYVFEADLGKYTHWSVQHHYQPLIRELLHVPAFRK